MFKTLLDQKEFAHSVSKVVCVGRNYADHAKELNNPIPTSPILFIKPASSVVAFSAFSIPENQGSVHHELEIAVLIGKTLSNADTRQVRDALVGVGLGLDLTLRDVQAKLKEKGHPWERAKAFDGACPLSEFVAVDDSIDWKNIGLVLNKNGQLQQQGNSADMLFPVVELIAHMSESFTLNAGDIILTGTPAGVGPIEAGDQLTAELFVADQRILNLSAQVNS